jgi:hypothetical protein
VGAERAGRIEEPVEGVAEVVGGVRAGTGQVAFDILDGTRQDVQVVPKGIERRSRHDQLVLADAELFGSPTGLEVPLPTGLLAEAPGPPGSSRDRYGPPTPRAPRLAPRGSAAVIHGRFCHCDEL